MKFIDETLNESDSSSLRVYSPGTDSLAEVDWSPNLAVTSHESLG